MLIDIDTRRPLKFSRNAESPEGDEVTIEIKYDMLFKHCSTCGMLTHEKEYYSSLGIKDKTLPQLDRPDVFARVQLPAEGSQYQLVKKEYRINARPTQASISYKDRTDRNYNSSRYGHSKRKPEFEALSRYGGVRNGKGPYDRHQGTIWREKQRVEHQGPCSSGAPKTRDQDRVETSSVARDAVSYGHASASRTNDPLLHETKSSERKSTREAHSTRRLASTIVTPSRIDLEMEENATKRSKGAPRSLSFTTLGDQELTNVAGDDQIIDALNGMDIEDQQDGGMVDCEVQNDDLLGMELAEMEDNDVQPVLHKPQKHDAKFPRSIVEKL
ncbi:hypothetical protein Bca52824_081042 [Brassica carinata]|uniref:Zinc knuckle CX2CX4HX4C domain-containing protein n=1 Tax=Brassica carinata TaxID=52824 RepID=A0A8X7TRJ0_BRACI|nr:hypothetical protein Bca52824_081042 [Brassica carinata]